MASQRVIVTAWDICTNTFLTDLQAINPTYTERLNDAGPFSFSLDLTDRQTADQTSVILGLGGGPFKVIFSDTDKNIEYTGIVRTARLSPSSPLIDITGTMLAGYFSSVFAAKSYTASISPAVLLSNVVRDVQLVHGANIHITPNMRLVNPPAPFLPAYQVGQKVVVSQIMSDVTMGVTPGQGGVDYSMQSTYQPGGKPLHLLNIAAPRAGHDKTTSGLSIDLSHVIDWGMSSDNSTTANEITVVGSGTGASQPVAVATAPTLIGGLGQPPLMQGLLQFNRVTSQTHLAAIANGAVQMFGAPVRVFSVTMPTDYEPCALGVFSIGDDVKLSSPPSPWFPRGLSEWWRIVEYRVSYPTEGVATVSLTLNSPPII